MLEATRFSHSVARTVSAGVSKKGGSQPDSRALGLQQGGDGSMTSYPAYYRTKSHVWHPSIPFRVLTSANFEPRLYGFRHHPSPFVYYLFIYLVFISSVAVHLAKNTSCASPLFIVLLILCLSTLMFMCLPAIASGARAVTGLLL